MHFSSIFLDYNAPLTENGAYTEKYNRAAEMISVYDTLSSLLGTSINDVAVGTFLRFLTHPSQFNELLCISW
jgi:hypothetical protein